VIGIDESGNGAFLGSMYVAGVYIKNNSDLPNVKDSKKLRDKEIFKKAKELYKNQNTQIIVCEITPNQMDNREFPEILYKGHSEIINRLNVESDTAYLDSALSDNKLFAKKISKRENQDTIIVSRNSADEKYDIVSAASIIAASKRKEHIKKLSNEYGDLGNGYSSDSKTREFVKNYYKQNKEAPDIVREKCSTYEKIISSIVTN
jgi:ribonuclease HII